LHNFGDEHFAKAEKAAAEKSQAAAAE